jgi:hypothetical protein
MKMTPKGVILTAYILAGITPGTAAFLWFVTGWGFLKGVAIAGLVIFICMAILYATSDKKHFDNELEKIEKDWEKEDAEREDS